MNEYVKLGIWVVVVGVIFLFLWRKGYLMRLSNYVIETREELKKCSWPSVPELRGSTVVVLVSVAMLGVFTLCVDYVWSLLVRAIT